MGMRVHRMTVRSIAKKGHSGSYRGLDINASLRAAHKELESFPEVSFKNGITCKFGNVPLISGMIRTPLEGDMYKEDSYLLFGSSIFMHLGGNAINAGATRFTVETYRRGALAVVDVSDDGCGIPKHLEKKIFNRGATFTTDHYNGHQGLGLYYTMVVVEHFGGTIGLVRNVPKGTTAKGPTGVTFRITLPIDGFRFG